MAAPAIGVRLGWVRGGVDWSHPLSNGLVAVGSGSVELSGLAGPPSAPSVGRADSPSPFGPSISGTATPGDGGWLFPVTPVLGAAVTLSAWMLTSSPGGMGLGWGDAAQAKGLGMGTGAGTMDSPSSLDLLGLDSNVAWRVSGYTFTAGWHHVAMVGTSGGAYQFYVDGLAVGSNPSCGYTVNVAGASYVRVAGEATNARASASPVAAWHVYGRALTAAEVASLSADPFCMMRG